MDSDQKLRHGVAASVIVSLEKELKSLDVDLVDVGGQKLKPSQCYRFEVDPPHIMFNTNCPDHVRQKVQSIFSRFIPPDESRSS